MTGVRRPSRCSARDTGKPTLLRTMTVALRNLGCSKNLVDGQRFLGQLIATGQYTITDDFSRADLIVVNTCSFIREATQEAIDAILELAAYKKTGRCSRLAVMGCFSERYRTRIPAQLPEVDLWIGTQDSDTEVQRHFGVSPTAASDRALEGAPVTEHLKIAEGCDHRCSFCVIPSLRGPLRSRSIPSIIQEAQWLHDKGIRECILVSQDTTSFGKDNGDTLIRLLETLLAETAFPWIRMMYLHPLLVTDDLLRLVASEERLCPYFDIPLQHIADPILRSMRRRPLSGGIIDLVERIRALVPDAAIRTTFIIGYPGETEARFTRLVDFVERARFEKLGVFPFSPEEGTEAYALRPRPQSSTATRRCETLMEAQRAISRSILEGHVGKTVTAIIDRASDTDPSRFEGRTRWDAPEIDGTVFVSGTGVRPGTFVRVRIEEASDYDLFARASADHEGASGG